MKYQGSILVLLVSLSIVLSIVLADVPLVKNTQINWKDDVVWHPQDPKVAFVSVADNTLWRTGDGGLNWSSLGKKITSLIFSSTNADKVFGYNSKTGIMFKSESKGENFSPIQSKVNLLKVMPHPTQPNTLLGVHKVDALTYKIVYSVNFGDTWTFAFNDYTLSFDGVEPVAPIWDQTATGTPYHNENGIYAAIIVNNKDKSKALIYSTDFGKTVKTIISDVTDIACSKSYMYAVGVSKQVESFAYTLRLSAPVKNDMNGFQPCQFPYGVKLGNFYQVIDDSDSAIWLGIYSKEVDFKGTVYVSNEQGNLFTVSLDNVYKSSSKFDVQSFSGIPGVYVANNATRSTKIAEDTVTNTLITYNNGGDWQPIKVPEGETCSFTSCSLNLHGLSAYEDRTRGFGPFYAIPSGAAVAVATGTVGQYLKIKPNPEKVKTFLTRNGGIDWEIIYNQPTIYEFGAWGSILVFAECYGDVNEVYYSLDQGNTKTSIQLPNIKKDVEIIDIISAPGDADSIFIVRAQDMSDRKNPVGYFFTIDFAPMKITECQDKDMEEFVAKGPGCINGGTIEYFRRQREAQCVLTKAPSVEEADKCDCTPLDYECDFGYQEIDSTKDKLVCQVVTQPSTDPPADCPATYTITKGFRKIAGNQCSGGVAKQYDPTVKDCPGAKGGSKSKGWIAAVVIIILLVVFGGIGFAFYKKPELRDKVRKVLGIGKSTKYSVVGIKPNSLADDEFGIEDDDAQILVDNGN
eukprot:gene1394-1762_t